ncbi:MAG: hypothetical protein IJG39_10230 [Synergistaceae bacterium]|nr:hypothetical protein [Synergistaceae bacterium]
MARSVLEDIHVFLGLDNGTDAEGNTILLKTRLGHVSKTSFDPDKLIAVIGALEPCLNKTIEKIEVRHISSLSVG